MSDFYTIEIRLKIQGATWADIVEDEIPIVVNLQALQRSLAEAAEFDGHVHQGIPDRNLADAIAAGIAAAEGCEVRWNYMNSQQGHYVGR